MNLYSTALAFHIGATLVLLAALAWEWVNVVRLARAQTTQQARVRLRMVDLSRLIGMVSMLTLVVSGGYMVNIAWVGAAWPHTALAALVVVSAISMAFTLRLLGAIRRAAAGSEGEIPPALQQLLRKMAPQISIQTRVIVTAGIVFLMMTKPGLSGSLVAMGVTAVLAFVSTLPLMIRDMARKEPA